MKGSVYLEKDCTDILKQVEQNEADGHNTLGRYLTIET
jgi:DNA modification methylase